MNIFKKLYWKITAPLKNAILGDGVVVDIRERLVHIEDKITPSPPPPYANSKFATLSYAQLGEDTVIMKLFTEVLKIKKPTYIDIGAHHPYEISNTALFYKNGCWGINIEANPNLFALFEQERPHALNLCCGVGGNSVNGATMPFYMIDERSGRNSFAKAIVEGFVRDNPQFSIREVKQIPVKSLRAIFAENQVECCPDYMTIDIEGMEYETLRDFDLTADAPKVITLEINSYTTQGNLLTALLEESGYFLWLKIYHNYTFVKNEYKGYVYA